MLDFIIIFDFCLKKPVVNIYRYNSYIKKCKTTHKIINYILNRLNSVLLENKTFNTFLLPFGT